MLTLHCVVNRQLVAKNIYEKSKDHTLNIRPFKQQCQENDEECEWLLLHYIQK